MRCPRDEHDLDEVRYAMDVTGHLYAGMLAAALEQADLDQPVTYGRSVEEAALMGQN